MRIEPQPIGAGGQASEPQPRRLPYPALSCDMHPQRRVAPDITLVDLRGPPKIAFRCRYVAKSCGHQRMDSWTQGASLAATRRIVREVGRPHLWRERVPKQR